MGNRIGRPTHGFYKSHPELYGRWEAMIGRCCQPSNGSYHKYGARGITVCAEWLDAGAFCRWALANGWAAGLSLDRKRNHEGYSPDNCRWTTRRNQAANRRVQRRSASRFKGVERSNGRWRAVISVNGARVRLGRFDTAEAAARAYDAAAREAYGEFACVNFQ